MPATTHAHPSPHHSGRRTLLALWAGLLGPPAAWILQLQLTYALVPWVCRSQKHWVLHRSALVFLAVSLGAGLVAWREWRGTDPERSTQASDILAVHKFMALLGLLTAGLFSLLIVGQGLATLMIDPCHD